MELKSKKKFENDIKEGNNVDLDYLKVINEKENFPIKFSDFVPFKKILDYYDNNWTENLDDDDSDDESDDDVRVKKNIYDDSSSDE